MIYTIVRRDKSDKIDAVISFDSISSVDESWSATVTSQTVEYGFNISDNINIEAPSYSISATISSYSLFNKDREIVWDGTDFTSKGTPDPLSHIVARDEIVKVFTDMSLVTLIESAANSNDPDLTKRVGEVKSSWFNEIEDCIITSLSISHPSSGTGAFLISMTLQKIVIAEIEVKELVGDEKRALIKPLMQVYTPTTSSSKTEKGDENTDTGTGSAEEEVEKEKPKGNREEKGKERRKARGVDVYDDIHKAEAAVRHLMETTNQSYRVIKQSKGFVIIEGLDTSVIPNGGK